MTPAARGFAAAVSTASDTSAAAQEVAQQVAEQLGEAGDLVVLLASPHHRDTLEQACQQVRAALKPTCLIGCIGENILAGSQEYEQQPALAVWGARLPGVALTPVHLKFVRTAEGGSILGWPESLQEPWGDNASLLLMGEPFSFPADLLLDQVNTEQPGAQILGGMASGFYGPGENRIVLGDEVLSEGAAGILIQGDLSVRSIVSQGCQPIGDSMVITKAERNEIHELGGMPALDRLQAVFASLNPEQRELIQQGLHLGRVINEYQDSFGPGDFLVRNVIGIDTENKSISLTDYIRVGQTVQFHLRDEHSADEDLNTLLAQVAPQPEAALVFTCNGRGTRLFSEPHHDASSLRAAWGEIPVIGFFAQGEIGPLGGQNFMHGFTAAVALFGARDGDS